MEEIIDLAIEDPIAREVISKSRFSEIVLKYTEPDLVRSTERALGSIADVKTHHIWSDVISGRLLEMEPGLPSPSNAIEDLKNSLTCV